MGWPGRTWTRLQFEDLLAEARAALREGDARAAAASIASALALCRGPSLQGSPNWRGSAARRAGSTGCASTRSRSSSRQRSRSASIARSLSQLRETLEENPFRERLWGQLMLALYRSGRQADALEAFQEARRVLAEELGLEPGPDLKRLQESILAQDPAIAAAPVSVAAQQPSQPDDVLRRSRAGAGRGRRASPRTAAGDADRPAGRGQEPARARSGALARGRGRRRGMAGRGCARRRRFRCRRPARSRARRTRPRSPRARARAPARRRCASSFSMPASTPSKRRRSSPRRCWRNVATSVSSRRAARRFISSARFASASSLCPSGTRAPARLPTRRRCSCSPRAPVPRARTSS